MAPLSDLLTHIQNYTTLEQGAQVLGGHNGCERKVWVMTIGISHCSVKTTFSNITMETSGLLRTRSYFL